MKGPIFLTVHVPCDIVDEVSLYRRACRRHGVVTSRHVEDGLKKGSVEATFSQLTSEELKAICVAVVVSHHLFCPSARLSSVRKPNTYMPIRTLALLFSIVLLYMLLFSVCLSCLSAAILYLCVCLSAPLSLIHI